MSIEQIETTNDLRRAWRVIVGHFRRDLAFAGRLASDPIATLHEIGYDVRGEAALALQRALPE